MSMPSMDFVKQLVENLKSGNIGWFRDQWKSGGLSFLKDHLPGKDYDDVGKGIEGGDLNPLKKHLGSVKIPGLDLPDLGNLGNLAGAAKGAAAGAVGAAAGKVAGATPNLPNMPNMPKKAFDIKKLIPVALLAVVAAFALSRCGNDDKKVSIDSVVESVSSDVSGAVSEASEAVADVSEAVSAESTVAP
jgi:hypothetical protein